MVPDPVAATVACLRGGGLDACAGLDVDRLSPTLGPVVVVEQGVPVPVHSASWAFAHNCLLICTVIAGEAGVALDTCGQVLELVDAWWGSGQACAGVWVSHLRITAAPMLAPGGPEGFYQARCEFKVVARSA